MDAGDLLEVLLHAGVQVVLSGHKHVPYVWRLENMYIANAGTVSSLRVRGYTKPCYNVLEFDGDEVKIHRKFPFGDGHVMAHFSLSGAQFHRDRERPVEERTVLRRRADTAPHHGTADPGGAIPRMRIVVLVDGEHYPPVTRWGIDTARERGHEVVGALLVGGTEKLGRRRRARSGRAAPMVAGPIAWPRSPRRSTRFAPEGVLDLSDEPVLGYRERMELASVALAPRLPYLGADFRLDPPIEGPPCRRRRRSR